MKLIEPHSKSFIESSNDFANAPSDGQPCSDLRLQVRRDGGAGRRHVYDKATKCPPVVQDQVCMRVFGDHSLLLSIIDDGILLLSFEPTEFAGEALARLFRDSDVYK